MFRKNDIVVVKDSHYEKWLCGCVLRLTLFSFFSLRGARYFGECIDTNQKTPTSAGYLTQTIGAEYVFPPESLELLLDNP